MGQKTDKIIFWTPRVLSIIFILFLMLFSLDVISPNLTFGQIAVGMLIHNIPSFVLLIILIISWKREIVGGIAYCLFGLWYFFSVVAGPHNLLSSILWSLTIAGPAILIGILFFLGWKKRRQNIKVDKI